MGSAMPCPSSLLREGAGTARRGHRIAAHEQETPGAPAFSTIKGERRQMKPHAVSTDTGKRNWIMDAASRIEV